MTRSWEIREGDWIERLREMPDESVHCVVTSPPYWGLRDYGAVGQLGLERTPEEYITKMVEGFREVRRVLRGDGTLWLNMGDCYYQGAKGNSGDLGSHALRRGETLGPTRKGGLPAEYKAKDLIGMPWMLAFALRADGWYLRSDIIWAKPNPMPESVTDRPTKAHEYIFLLTKSATYFYDAAAIAEETIWAKDDPRQMDPDYEAPRTDRGFPGQASKSCGILKARLVGDELVRNKRSVWTVATNPFPEAHFATFPPKLVEPCILAGTSERGCCPSCGAPWERITEVGYASTPKACKGTTNSRVQAGETNDQGSNRARDGHVKGLCRADQTIGWEPTCSCNAGDPVPCIVYDPFCGAGTTGLVALRLGRNFRGSDLKPEYCAMARRRIEQDAPLFNTVNA